MGELWLAGSSAADVRPALDEELAALEIDVSYCLDGLQARAEAAVALAEAHDLASFAGRARIVLADLALRGGDRDGGLSLAQKVLAAAPDNAEHAVVRSRAHCLLGWGFSLLGLGDEGLVHCLQAVRELPRNTPPHVRILAETMFVLVQGLHLPGDGYRGTSTAAVAAAERLGNPKVLLEVLNNAVWLDWQHGHQADALAGVERLEDLAAAGGVWLTSTILDTIANVALSAGDVQRAEAFNAAAISPSSTHVDFNTVPDAMFMTVRLARMRGDLQDGLRWARLAQDLAARHGLPEVQARALQQEGEMLAESGDFEKAYRAQVEFHRRWEQLRSELTDARTALLASEYETERARRESERNAELAEKDPLTGLWNRRHLSRRAPSLLAQARLCQEPFSFAIIDVDGFKKVNDDFSHTVGDSVLQTVAAILLASVPAAGWAVRLGGDEFLLVLPGRDADAARAIGEEVCHRFRVTDWHAVAASAGSAAPPGTAGSPGAAGPAVSATVGIATANPDQGIGEVVIADLLRAADTSLYGGKRGGRDRVGELVAVPALRHLG